MSGSGNKNEDFLAFISLKIGHFSVCLTPYKKKQQLINNKIDSRVKIFHPKELFVSVCCSQRTCSWPVRWREQRWSSQTLVLPSRCRGTNRHGLVRNKIIATQCFNLFSVFISQCSLSTAVFASAWKPPWLLEKIRKYYISDLEFSFQFNVIVICSVFEKW